MQEMSFAAHGHAAFFIMATMDRYWKPDMSLEEAIALMKKCFQELHARYLVNFKSYYVKKVSLDGIEELNVSL